MTAATNSAISSWNGARNTARAADNWVEIREFTGKQGLALLAETGCTEAEAAAFVALVASKPARVERMQMELFPEVDYAA